VSNLGQHDGDGIRYAMHLSAPKGGSAQMLRDPAGGWVSWEDYTRLKDEVERLTELFRKTERLMLLDGEYEAVKAGTVARLKAEVERLTKAGYAMAIKINVHGINDRFTDSQKLVDDWSNAAKKGGQP
jgi:hypothetical protein